MDFQKALRAFFKSDCSSAYSRNDALYHSASRLIAEGSIEGVVYHVLKGQIEYDFDWNVWRNCSLIMMFRYAAWRQITIIRILSSCASAWRRSRKLYRRNGIARRCSRYEKS